jgi:hypothetical protein
LAKDLLKIHDNYNNLIKSITQSTLPEAPPNPPTPPPIQHNRINEHQMFSHVPMNKMTIYAPYVINKQRPYPSRPVQDPISQMTSIPIFAWQSSVWNGVEQNQVLIDLAMRAIQQIVFSPISFKEEIIERILYFYILFK